MFKLKNKIKKITLNMLNVIYLLPIFKNDKIEFNHKIRKKNTKSTQVPP